MKSKSILTFALATLVIGGLASCGPTTNPTTSDGGTTSVPPSGDTLEIQFWSTFNKSFHDQIETHINEFEKIILENEGVKKAIKLIEEKSQYFNCPRCNKVSKMVNILHIGRNKIVLEPEKQLYQNHLDKYSSEYNKPVCKIITNKKNPNLWGIKLNLKEDVKIIDAYQTEKQIKADGVIPIIKDLTIEFPENVVGKIL